MTSQQTGREAFSPEAIAAFRREKGNGMESAVGEYTPPEFWDALDEIERLQAALSARAQGGREVGEAVAWLCSTPDGVTVNVTASEHARNDYARFGRTITPLYTSAPKQQDDACPSCHRAWGEHRLGYSASRCNQKPAPKQQAVTNEDVRWCRDIAGDLREAGGPTNAMRLVALERLIRAAALAALPGKTEVE